MMGAAKMTAMLACVAVVASALASGMPTVFDGSQSNTVIAASAAGAKRVTLSFRVQSPKSENPTMVFLAECGFFESNNAFRVTFNGQRERRVCGFYGGKRVYSEPGALDDGRLHHVALDVEPGCRMTLYLDGSAVAATDVPDLGFADGPLAVAHRTYIGPSDKAWYVQHYRNFRFRGRLSDVNLQTAAFDPAAVPGGTAVRDAALSLPADPYAAKPQWLRPKTTRRYLHGPFSERLLTFWREGKIAFGEVEHRDDWSLSYWGLRAHAAWLVHGDLDEAFDFRTAELNVTESGDPDHVQKWHVGDLEVELAACAPVVRKPSAFVRLTLRNRGASERSESFAFLLREGLEKDLLYGAPDVYKIFRPSVQDWREVSPEGWERRGDALFNGTRFASFAGMPFEWDAKKGAVRFRVSLPPGGERSVEMELGRGEVCGTGYAAARESMLKAWRDELAKLSLPSSLGVREAKIVRHLVVQMLQCLSAPAGGGDFTIPRQGGLQRYVWPGDAMPYLAGLDATGYGAYVAKAIDFYYGRCQRESGEIGPFRNRWASDTASVLESFAWHCIAAGDRACWNRHRAAALRSWAWIEAKRAEGGGIFPAMKATDHKGVARFWASTDLRNLAGMELFARAAELFGDPCAAETAASAREYRALIGKTLDIWRAKSSGRDELFIPITAEGEDDALNEAFMFYVHPAKFAGAGFLSADEMTRQRRWLMRHGYANANGLYQNHLSRDPESREHVWYTTCPELLWFRAWRRVGRNDLADEALQACLKFALSDEMYVGERYHDANPWFYPWSPNASGSGRIILMLLESAGAPDPVNSKLRACRNGCREDWRGML